jgi:asparagine synthase (glutamine-hydrolysing)
MCGIAGIVSKSKVDDGHINSVKRMIAALVHRGPDGVGEFCDDSVAMGMRRLSIIDLNGGWQPLFNEDKSLVLVANGEIYNYIELTTSLQAKGHNYFTHSDCESILHLYEEYGVDCVHHLRGMFAFALYDIKNHMVLLARDRMGEKPLYYHQKEGLIFFASEIKSLLSSGRIPFSLDPVSVNNYFHYGYVPEPRTPLIDVHKVPAGHYLVIHLDNWRILKKQYWQMEDASPVDGDPATLIRNELEKISELIIRSDVPVGIALSGGLDSSAIAALSVKKYPGIMHAFSVGYPGKPSNDERNSARMLADYLKMPFHEIELTTQNFAEIFEELIFMRDDPIADISGYGYYAVSREARNKGVPVLLQGQGGDELFWGYSWVRDAALMTEDRLNGSSFLKTGYHLLKYTSPDLHFKNIRQFYRWARNVAKILKSRKQVDSNPIKYRPIFHELQPDFQDALNNLGCYYTPSFNETLSDSSAFDLFTYAAPWAFSDIRITKLICETYLLENGISQGDRLSMANSVELRLPFVDYKLVELIIGLRKTHQNDPDFRYFPKPWLRDAIKDIVPDWVINRPKQGFAPPVHEWHSQIFMKYGRYLHDGYLVQTDILSGDAGDMLSNGPFPPGIVTPISFKALILEIWCRKMINIINSLNGGEVAKKRCKEQYD